MRILEDLCRPSQCDRECVEACIQVHGEDTPLKFPANAQLPTIANGCTRCLACIRACPLGAITTSYEEESLTPSSAVQSSQKGSEYSRPYEVSESYSRFSEKDMVFARVHNDSSFEHFGKDEWYGAEAMIAKRIPGYGEFEREMAGAGWELYDNRQSVMGPLLQDANHRRSGTPTDGSDPGELTRATKRAARLYGASLVGVAALDSKWLYTADRQGVPYNIPKTYNRAIIMAVELDYEGISTSPAFPASAAVGVGYSMMAFAEIELTAFIRRLGYGAIPCGNDIALSVPLAIDAGLGQYGRHGILITKEFGPRVRIAKVLTDMPLQVDKPDHGFCEAVKRFCETCEKCADHCPSKSIPKGRARTWNGETISNNPGVKKWYVNPETCYGFWMDNGSDCSNCIRSCPYNKKDGILHRSILWVVRRLPWMNRVILTFDNLLGYGKQREPGALWRKYS
ncbi:MAG: reductive dehalogenase [Candidatus Thorarchaeota archaeon]